jgi:hypothetical protein
VALLAGCPRCVCPVVEREDGWACPDHGVIIPLWRPAEATYDGFAAALGAAGDFPTYLPWPMSPGWAITDVGVVAQGNRVRGSVTCSSGTSELDGPVDVFVVAEEAGTGLGARCASTVRADPGADLGDGPPQVRIRIGSKSVPLWSVSTSTADGRFDRSVFAGEADGRWLWMVLRPASAMLLLRDEWILREAADVGPEMLDLTFGGNPPNW